MHAHTNILRGRWSLIATVAMVLVGHLATTEPAFALTYSAKSISAVVIDADTKQPLSDVNVLVVWELQDSNASSESTWVFMEAITDKNGHFAFSGWGPKVVPQSLRELPRRLGPEQPTFYLFKSGYLFGIEANPWESWMLGNRAWTGDLIRSSVWNGKTFELEKFAGSNGQYLDRLSMTAGGLPMQACRWAQIPMLTAALVKERGDRIKFPATSSLPTMKSLEEKAKSVPGCPSPQVVLAPYLK